MDESATTSLSEALVTELQRAIHALPMTYRKEPEHGETVNDPHEGFVRLQDWAFTQGFALVKESSRPNRVVLVYIIIKKHGIQERHQLQSVQGSGLPVKSKV